MAFAEGSTQGTITGPVTYSTLVDAPAAGYTRVIRLLSILNRSHENVGVELFALDGAVYTQIAAPTLTTYQAFQWPDVLVLNSTSKSVVARLTTTPNTESTFVTSYADANVPLASTTPPADAPYIVTTYNATLTGERVLNPLAPLYGVDQGANDALDIKFDLLLVAERTDIGDNDLILMQDGTTGALFRVRKSVLVNPLYAEVMK